MLAALSAPPSWETAALKVGAGSCWDFPWNLLLSQGLLAIEQPERERELQACAWIVRVESGDVGNGRQAADEGRAVHIGLLSCLGHVVLVREVQAQGGEIFGAVLAVVTCQPGEAGVHELLSRQLGGRTLVEVAGQVVVKRVDPYVRIAQLAQLEGDTGLYGTR